MDTEFQTSYRSPRSRPPTGPLKAAGQAEVRAPGRASGAVESARTQPQVPYGEVTAALTRAGVSFTWGDPRGDFGLTDALVLRLASSRAVAGALAVLGRQGYGPVIGDGSRLRFEHPQRPFEDLIVAVGPQP